MPCVEGWGRRKRLATMQSKEAHNNAVFKKGATGYSRAVCCNDIRHTTYICHTTCFPTLPPATRSAIHSLATESLSSRLSTAHWSMGTPQRLDSRLRGKISHSLPTPSLHLLNSREPCIAEELRSRGEEGVWVETQRHKCTRTLDNRDMACTLSQR